MEDDHIQTHLHESQPPRDQQCTQFLSQYTRIFFLRDLEPHYCINILFHKNKRELWKQTHQQAVLASFHQRACLSVDNCGRGCFAAFALAACMLDERHHFRRLLLVRLKVRCERLGNTVLDERRALTTPEAAAILLLCGCVDCHPPPASK